MERIPAHLGCRVHDRARRHGGGRAEWQQRPVRGGAPRRPDDGRGAPLRRDAEERFRGGGRFRHGNGLPDRSRRPGADQSSRRRKVALHLGVDRARPEGARSPAGRGCGPRRGGAARAPRRGGRSRAAVASGGRTGRGRTRGWRASPGHRESIVPAVGADHGHREQDRG